MASGLFSEQVYNITSENGPTGPIKILGPRDQDEKSNHLQRSGPVSAQQNQANTEGI